MTSVVVALAEPRASALGADLERDGVHVVGIVGPANLTAELLSEADTVILPATRAALTNELVQACDRSGVRIITLGAGDSRLLGRYGLPEALPEDADAWQIADALSDETPATVPPARPSRRRVIAVWGPHGAPGRSTVAIQLAVEVTRSGQTCALVDADTVAPSLALLLGLGDDSPGIAAACRRAELGGLDAAELGRLATRVETSGGSLEVLGGLNRPSRWPELAAGRLSATLQVCREWTDVTIVDVAAAFDADEEITDDLAGPRRNAATTTALREADVVVAVTAADPLSVSRFLRDHAELRRLIGPTARISVVANQVRPGPLGIDARGQIRGALERFAGITDVSFLPLDQRAADAALLHARPMADVTPRSALVAAVRRLAEALESERSAGPSVTADSRRGSSRVARWLRPAHEARAASPL
ncbi:AAA family ATPase [Microbacterium murale]|uniref:MinD-like ATPase involved in chromosome partitioning or flagellar assembly n=1 Tax=Microbacterium murale TaxID=1081040 RepID=A0ABU0PCN6_9MICO|nr:P-loop NTPase [Microbacterium murale]MDQ0645096.1 MinD-like ATPase involved in chromosome partitioning or flagellar assembly [Microbacterium murale]